MDYKVKETVTRENIIADIKNEYRSRLSDCGLVTFVGFAMLIFVFIYIRYENINLTSNIFALTVLILITLGVCCIAGYFIFLFYIYLSGAKKFKTVTDDLKEIAIGKQVHFFSKNHGSSYFRFATYGIYSIFDRQTYHSWSERHCTDATGLYHSSSPNDTFYLIILNKNIVCVYNQKYFVLSDSIN